MDLPKDEANCTLSGLKLSPMVLVGMATGLCPSTSNGLYLVELSSPLGDETPSDPGRAPPRPHMTLLHAMWGSNYFTCCLLTAHCQSVLLRAKALTI